ncbi:mercury resistance system substrate-binding protein MerP [Pseudobacillus badius]|uniref:mercury resistance system substrate-binding protein MerP n=1 Tax=Bacillus badius TaxID=1455 RepID=UPI003D347998
MRGRTLGIIIISLFLLLSACSNPKEVQNTGVIKKTETFTVSGMDCCPPSVVESIIKKVNGVSNAVIKASGSTGVATVSFDDKKTSLKTIKKQFQSMDLEYSKGVIKNEEISSKRSRYDLYGM